MTNMTELEAVQQGFKIGTIKWFDEVRGYGFIIDDETRRDVFCHKSAFTKAGIEPKDNARIAFRSAEGPKGIAANELTYVRGAE